MQMFSYPIVYFTVGQWVEKGNAGCNSIMQLTSGPTDEERPEMWTGLHKQQGDGG